MSRGEIDAYTEFVKIYGAKGLAWIKVNDAAQGPRGPAVADRQEPARRGARRGARSAPARQDGDLIFFGADKAKVVNDALGALRVKVGHSDFGKARGLAQGEWEPLWVVDFPMFEYDEAAGRWNAVHHPFTAPKDGHEDWLETDPGRCIAKAYDVVLNGIELGGGSVRIHREEVQSKVFRALKIDAEEAQAKFGFLLDALQYGAPPHGGIAIGLDRFVMLMTERRVAARRDRLPEDAARAGPAHQRARAGRREAAARAAHPPAQHQARRPERRAARTCAESRGRGTLGARRVPMTRTRSRFPNRCWSSSTRRRLEVLLIERADAPGYWQSVTGSQGSRRRAAASRPAVREVAEETGHRRSAGAGASHARLACATGRWRTSTRSTRSGGTAMLPA